MCAALARGLTRLTFLEHLEEGISSPVVTWLNEAAFDQYFTEGKRLRKLYQGHIEIGLGVECGYNPEAVEALRLRLGRRSWDCVGISCHFLKVATAPHHLNLFSRRRENLELARREGPERLLSRYFATLCEAVAELAAGTVLCHLDGALRHLPGLVLTEEHLAQIATLLDLVKQKELLLELNTSGFAIRGQPFPRQEIIAMARQRAIPFHLGSDAHQPEEVGRYFSEAYNLILAAPC